MKLVTVDLDSTLCDTTPRRSLLNQEDRQLTDWHEYAKACHMDLPHGGVVTALRLILRSGIKWAVVSGRSEESREMTEEWINNLCEEEGFRRPEFIHLDDSMGTWEEHHGHYKARRLAALQHMGFDIELHIDDWPAVRTIVESETGIPVLCVTPTFVTQESLSSLQ